MNNLSQETYIENPLNKRGDFWDFSKIAWYLPLRPLSPTWEDEIRLNPP